MNAGRSSRRQIASGSEDGTVRIWDAVSGELLQTLAGHEDTVFSIAYSPDGRRLYACGGRHSGAMKAGELIVGDLSTGKPTQTLTGNAGRPLGEG